MFNRVFTDPACRVISIIRRLFIKKIKLSPKTKFLRQS